MRKEPLIRRMDRNVARATKHELRAEPERLKHAMAGMTAMAAGEIWIQEFSARKQGVEEAAKVIERRRGMGHEIDNMIRLSRNISSMLSISCSRKGVGSPTSMSSNTNSSALSRISSNS